MKKSLLALAVAAALPAAAQAQSSITLYGIADVAVEYSNDQANSALVSGSLNRGKSGARVNSGGWMSSRLGMRGTEPLGKTGMSAIFNIEHRFQIDTGDTQGGNVTLLPGAANTTTTNNKFWNGTAWVGLSTGFGDVTMGRQYTPIFWAMYFPDWTLNAGYNNWAATTGNPGAFAFGGLQSLYYGAVRADNSIVYKSPAIGGLTVYGMYSFGENYRPTADALGSATEIGSGDVWGVSGVWRMGNLMVTGGYHKHDNKVFSAALNPTVIDQAFAGTVGYNFGAFGVSVGYTQLKFDNFAAAGSYDSKIETYLLSAFARVGPGRLYANVEQLNPSGFVGSKNGDGLQVGVTYMWELSNRSGIYFGVGTNDYSGFQSPTAARVLDNAMRYQIGVNHKF